MKCVRKISRRDGAPAEVISGRTTKASWFGHISVARFGVIAVMVFSCLCEAGHAQLADASGMVINERGAVLTAAHAVSGCEAIYLVQSGQVSRATVAARDSDEDLALLHSMIAPLLPAVFAHPSLTDEHMVFAESFDALRRNTPRTMFNAALVSAGDELLLLSSLGPGASGAPVLSRDGRVLGMVVARTAAAPGLAGRYALSRGYRAPARASATRTQAVPAERIQRFLTEAGEPFFASNAAQLGPGQAPSGRASTISVGVICERRQ